MTAEDVIDAVRYVLGDVPDEGETPRWADAQLLSALNRAGRWIMGRFGETRLQDDGSLSTWTDATDEDSTLALADGYFEPLLQATAAAAHESDSADQHDREMTQYHRSVAESIFRA